jgi:hypothetical protein
MCHVLRAWHIRDPVSVLLQKLTVISEGFLVLHLANLNPTCRFYTSHILPLTSSLKIPNRQLSLNRLMRSFVSKMDVNNSLTLLGNV